MQIPKKCGISTRYFVYIIFAILQNLNCLYVHVSVLLKYMNCDWQNIHVLILEIIFRVHTEKEVQKSLKEKKYCKMNYVTVKTFQNYTKSIRKSSKKFGGLYDASKWLFLCKNPKKKWQHDLRGNHKLRLQERGHSTKCQWYTLYTAFKKANRINT